MLHIVNKSPAQTRALDSCLRLAKPGQVLLLIEDAVYAATKGGAGAARLFDALKTLKVCVLKPDLDARGMGNQLVDGVTAVDYGGFVDLVAEHPVNQSWL